MLLTQLTLRYGHAIPSSRTDDRTLLLTKPSSRFHDACLEPVLVCCHTPFHDNIEPIENGPYAVETRSRAEIVWPCHYLQCSQDQ